MLKSCKIYLLVFLFNPYSFAQYDNVSLEHITSEDGLSYSVVKCILQDYQGMIWIGTKDGLNKYDGNKFTIYRNIPGDSTSLSYNWIIKLYEDSEKQLWIGTDGGGLCLYNRDLDNFVCYVPDKNDTTSLSSRQVNAIYEFKEEKQSTLWIATGGAVNRYIPEKNNFKHYYPEGKNRKYKTNQNWIGSIVQDGSNRLWIGTWQEGLFYYDAESDGFIRYQPEAENSDRLKNRNILKLFASQEGSKNILWMGTYLNGLHKIDLKSGQIKNFLAQSKNTADRVRSSVYDIHPGNGLSGNILWLGTYNGLYCLNTENEQFTHFKYKSGNPTSLKSNYIEAVYSDQSGIVWVGSDRGVSKLNPHRSNFINIGQNSTAKNNLINKTVFAVCVTNIDNRDVLWIGTSDGLHKYDRKSGYTSLLEHDPQDVNSLSSNSIFSILKSRHSEREFLWIGTINGLNKVDPVTGKIKRYFIPNMKAPANWIWSLAEDESGLIWVGTQETSIHCFNPVDEKFTRYSGYRPVYSLLFDSTGNLWTGLKAGLRKINIKSNISTWYWHNPNDEKTISHNQISAIFESRKKVLWIGTVSGLNKYNRETETFTRYSVEDGLPSNLICAILEDDQENLWISTGKGISKFNSENNSFKNFDTGDGLVGSEFKFLSACKNNKGEMFFGAINGLTMFHPDKIKNNTFIPPIVLTDFLLYNRSVRPGKNSVLKKNISETKDIKIPYNQSVFSFEFAALDYHNPKKNLYAHKMEGIDPDWVYTDATRRFATYTNLDPGEYIFRVRGSNNDDIWNKEGTSVQIIILPPWWRTNLAYGVYAILITGMVLGLWRFQINRIKMKQRMEMEHFEVEKLREVDQMKSRFFTNISHEFRTPLTLIKGPVKQIMTGDFKGNLAEQCLMILRNSDRLLSLINQILDISKLESGQMKLQVTKTDIHQFIRSLVLSFSSLAESKKITFKFAATEHITPGYIDRDKIEKIINNLVANAFKFTPQGGEISIMLDTGDMVLTNNLKQLNTNFRSASLAGSQSIQITVSNTGPGILPDHLDKIFDRFYQTANNYKKDGEGTGIGLALTKELTEACHGEISVSSIPDIQTTFTIKLPIAREYFSADELIDTQPEDSIHEPISNLRYPESSDQKRATKDEQQNASILIVEDNPDVTSYICSFLENEYTIITAENGEIGLRKTLQKYPDLVISDVMMPEMDGFELCRQIKSDERTSHIPVILLTAKADLESKLEGLEFGADDYISKPFEAEELKVRARNLIEQRRKLREKFSRIIDVQPADIAASSMDEEFLKRFMQVFEHHISESELSTEKIASEVGMSRSNLNRKLKALTNQSTHEFIRSLRLKRAAQLLMKSVGTIAEIAYMVGFNNPSHFAKVFRKQFGQTPGIFLEKNKLD